MTVNGLTVAIITGIALGIGLIIEKWDSEEDDDDY